MHAFCVGLDAVLQPYRDTLVKIEEQVTNENKSQFFSLYSILLKLKTLQLLYKSYVLNYVLRGFIFSRMVG